MSGPDEDGGTLAVAPAPAAVAASLRMPVLDKMRLLAILYVTVHHVRSVSGYDPWPPYVSLGDLGVGIFCAIAGYLAFRGVDAPVPWLRKRLVRIYPAFWIATLLAFGVTWAAGYKPISLVQLAVQLTGLGYYWYGLELVNQPTWFVSLILACYGVGFLAKVSRYPAVGLATAALVAGGICLAPGSHPAAVFIGVFCVSGLAAVAGVDLPGGPVSPWLRIPADYVYEYFLVHGVFIAGAAWLFPAERMLAACTMGVAASTVAAVGLKRLVGTMVSRPQSRSRAGATP